MRTSDISGARAIGTRGEFYAGALLLVALVFGGGGSPAPMAELIVEVSAAFIFSGWLFLAGKREPIARRIWILALIVLVLPLAQLVPLPPSIWHELPGRGLALANLSQAGGEGDWRPLSLMPHQTFSSALAMVPPLLLMLLCASMPVEKRNALFAVVAGVGFASLLIGVGQLQGGSGALRFYDYTHESWITGFQANRNATADIFLIAIIALGAFWSANARTRGLPVWAFAALLDLSVITAGPLPPSPPELLASPRFSQLLEEMLARFDNIVIDGPPVLGLADAPVIAAVADGTLLVIESERVGRGIIKTALRRLREVRPNILGAVLTKFDASKVGNSYSSYYGYEYYRYSHDDAG